MGLAEPGAAVDEERVVCLGGRFGDRERGGVREAVGRADDEEIKRVLRVQVSDPPRLGLALPPTGRRRGLGRGPRLDRDLDAATLAGRVADGGADEAAEMALDPL